MLQPDKSAKKVIAESYNRQFDELSNLQKDLLDIKIKHSDSDAEIPAVFSDDQLSLFKERNISPSMYADMDAMVGRSQEGWERAFNVIGRGLAKIPSAFIEPVGYIGDYVINEAYQDVEKGEKDFTNSFNQALKDYEKDVDEAFPVYTGDIGDKPGILSSGWWVKNGDSMIRSFGYYPYGAIAGRVIGAGLTKAASQAVKPILAGKEAADISKLALNIERASRLGSATFTGITQNYSEHMHSAGEAYANNYKEYKNIFAKQFPDATADEIDMKAKVKAGHDAAEIVKKGRINLIPEIASNYLLFRGPATTRALSDLATEGAKRTRQRAAAIVFDPTQEYFEEVLTGHLEAEARRKVGIEKGYYNEDNTNEVQRWADHVLSYEGVTEGLTGLIGSGPFTAYASVQDYRARANKIEREKENAAFAGDITKYRNLNEQALFNKFMHNAQAGTYSSLIKHFEDIANMSPEDASKRGMDPDYKEKAQGAIDKALAFENEYNSHLFQYKDPLKAQILTASRFVLNSIQDEMNEAELELSKQQGLSSDYFKAKGYPIELQSLVNAMIQIEALTLAGKSLEQEYSALEKDVKNNKDRTLDKRETGSDIRERIDFINKQLEKATTEKDKIQQTLTESDISLQEIQQILDEAIKDGSPIHNQAKAQAQVEGAKSRYALENDRYTNFVNNPAVLKKEADNITNAAKKAEKVAQENKKKDKAAKKAEKLKTKTTAAKQRAKSDKVQGQGSTADNIKAQEDSKNNLDNILDEGKEAPAEVRMEDEGPSINDKINRLLDEANQANNDAIETFQMMMEGQLTEEQNAKLEAAKANNDLLAKEAKNKNTEQESNTSEVSDAATDDKTIGENPEGSRQVKNFNYDKKKNGAIPFEPQSAATEEQDKNQLNRDTRRSLKNDPTGKVTIATKQVVEGSTAMGYLATEYEAQIIDTPKGKMFVRRTASKDKTKGLVPEVESPNFIQPGQEVTLRVVQEGSKGLRYVYDENGNAKEVSWKYSDFVNEDGTIDSKNIPIEIVATVQGEEKVIGYVHESDWVDAALPSGQPRNVLENDEFANNWEKQKNEIRALRQEIIDRDGNVTTTIESVSTGTPFLNVMMNEDSTVNGRTEWTGVKELMPGWREIPLAFRRLGSWQTNKDVHVDEIIANDADFSDGRVGLILPTKDPKQVFVAPLWTKPLDNSQIDTIFGAIIALEENGEASKAITDKLNFTFNKSNPKALHTLINRLVYTQSFEFNTENSNSTIYLDVNPKNNTIILASEGGRTIYTNKPNSVPKNLKDTAASVKSITDPANKAAVTELLSTLLPSININNANQSGGYVNVKLNSDGSLNDAVNYESYNDYAFELVQTNINGTNGFSSVNGKTEYVYINQPVIQFSKDFKGAKPAAKKKPGRTVVSTKTVDKGRQKGKKQVVYSTTTVEKVEGVNVKKIKYSVEIGGRKVSTSGKQLTGTEFLEQYDLDESSADLFEGVDLNNTLVTITEEIIPEEGSRFKNVIEVRVKTPDGTVEFTLVGKRKRETAALAEKVSVSPNQVSTPKEAVEKMSAEDFKIYNDANERLVDMAGVVSEKELLNDLEAIKLMELSDSLLAKYGFVSKAATEKPTVDDVLDDLNDEFNYSIDFSIEPASEPGKQLGLFETPEDLKENADVYSRLQPFFIDVESIPSNRQKEILSYTTAKVTNDFLKDDTITVEESLEKARQTFIKLRNAGDFSSKSEVFQNDINKVLENWDKVIELTKEELAIVHNITETKSKTAGRDLQQTDYSDEARWKSNPKKKASARMKVKMSQILKRNADGQPILNYLGLYSFYSYAEVWDGTMGTLTEPIHNLPAMIAHLNAKGKVNPMFSEIVTYIEKRFTEEEKNEFVSQFANAYISQKVLLFSKDKTETYTAEVIDSAANKSSNVIRDRWLSEQLDNPNLVKFSEDGEAYIDAEYVKSVQEDYAAEYNKLKDAKQLNSQEMFDLLAATLTKLSVTTPADTFKYLASTIPNTRRTVADDVLGQTFNYAINPNSRLGLMNLVFTAYQTNAPKIEDVKYDAEVQDNAKALYKNNPLKGDNFQGIVLKLADVTSEFGDPIYHISYRDGEGKSVYPYNGTTSMHVLLKLYENYSTDKVAKNLVDNILATHMGSVSRLLPKMLTNKDVLKIHYTDVLKDKYASDSNAVKRKYQGELQQELNSIWSFQNSNKNKGFFFGITKADRGVSELIEHDKIDFKDQVIIEDGKVTGLQKKAEDQLFNYVLGEMKRIHSTQVKLDENPEYLQGEKYREGSQYFHFFSFLNQHEIGQYITEEEMNLVYTGESFDGIPRLNIVNAEPVIRKALNSWTTSIINETLANWDNLGISKGKSKLSVSYMASLGDATLQDKLAIAAADLELNYIISNIEQQILFGGDIAEAYNGKGATISKKIESARSNNEKRLIGTDAPKVQGNYEKREYTAVTFKDRLVFSENHKYYDKLIGAGSPYGNPSNKSIESTDALEVTTTQEHIDMLKMHGEIPIAIYDSISAKVKEAIEDDNNPTNYYRLTEEETSFALKPVKPQYDFMHPDPKTGRLARFYRKSMSLPLLPDMTSDMQLDNIRIALEYEKVDRAGHKTSDKLSPYSTVDVYDKNGDILPVDKLRENIKNNTFTLYRDGLGIQQEKNVKESQRITLSTQKAKLTFQGLAEEMFTFDGKELTGQQIKERKEEIMSLIYKGKHDKILKRFGNISRDESGEILAIEGDTVDMKAFISAIKEEAKKRNWNINDIFSLDLKEDGTETLVPLPFIQSRKMLEGLMLSLVNGISNVKIPGITFVQSSSAGFKSTGAWSETTAEMRNEVVTTTSFDESKGLQGPRWNAETGEVIPGQVMVKFFYKDDNGNELDIKAKDEKGNFIFLFEKNGRLFLNPTKVPKEVRQMIGYRIPYQNIASEMPLEIVGFLPSNMELTVIVPDEILPQMGSDFDVDTLNTITSQYIVRKNEDGSVKGVYRKDRKKYADKFTQEDLLLDELRDIFWTTLTTSKKSFDKMSKGIDDPALENLAEEVDDILNKNKRTKTSIGRADQIASNISQRMGQVLIGPAAQANTLNAIFEEKNIHLAALRDGKQRIFTILGLFSDEKDSKGANKQLQFSDLSGENRTVYYKKGKKFYRTSSDVINIFLNAAVDNANKPTLGKLNMTLDTVSTSLFMAMGGVDISTIAYMMSQEVMREYTAEIEKIVPGLSEGDIYNREEEAYNIIEEKYRKLANIDESTQAQVVVEKYSDKRNEEKFEMLFQSDILKQELIIGAPNSGITKTEDYYRKQYAIIRKYKKFKGYSDKLGPIRKALNDSSVKGLGSTISGAKTQITRFDKLNVLPIEDKNDPNFAGLSNLANSEYSNLGKYLESAFTLFGNVYPTSTSLTMQIETLFTNNSASDVLTESNIDLIFDSIISNGWSYAIEQIFVKDLKEASSLYELRRKLFVEENNIAVQTKEAQNSDWGKTNEFVMALKPVLSTNRNKGKAAVNIDWASNPDNLAMQRGFASLFMGSKEEEQFGKNLLIAAYLNGGQQKATSYLKFIPFGALEKYGLINELHNDMFTSETITDSMSLVQQLFQHNPWLATKIDYKGLRKHVGIIGEGNNIQGITLPSMENLKDVPALTDFVYEDRSGVYYKDFLVAPVGKTFYLFKLAQTTNAGAEYTRIDLKGDKFGTEYNYTGSAFSYLENNKAIKTVVTTPGQQQPSGAVPHFVTPEVPTEVQIDVPQGMPMDVLEDFINKTDQAEYDLDAMLDTVINSASEGQVELAKMLKQKGVYRSHPIGKVEISDEVRTTSKGSIVLGHYKHDPNNPEQSQIVIYKGSQQRIKASDKKMAQTMLHEIVHYYTVAAIEERDTSLQAKRFSTAMENLWAKADKAFRENPEYQTANTTEKRARNNAIKYALYGNNKIGVKNVKEFVTGLTTEPSFQEFLNNIPYNKTETLYTKILNTVKAYFKSIARELGFDVKEGSALDVGLSEVLVFLNVQETVQTRIAPQDVRTAEKDIDLLAGALGSSRPVMDDQGNIVGEVIVEGPQATPHDVVQTIKEDIESKKTIPQSEKTFDSILEAAMSELTVYKTMVGQYGKDAVVKSLKRQYKNNVKAFEDAVDLEIFESRMNYFMVDSSDIPVGAHGEIAEIIVNIEARIKDLQRRKTLSTSVDKRIYLNSQIDSLQDDIEKLKEGENTFVIRDVATKQLEWSSKILERPTLSIQELNDASRIVDIWKFDNTKHLLSAEQLENTKNPTRKTFAEIGAVAEDISVTMAAKRTAWLKKYTEEQSTEPIEGKMFTEEGFLNLQDESTFKGMFLDAANFANPAVRAIDSALKTVARNAEDNALNLTLDIQAKFKELNTALTELGINEDIFLQKDEDGNPTGYFVSRFTNDYYNDLGKAHKMHQGAMSRIMSSTRLTGAQIVSERYEAFKKLYDTKNEIEIVIDSRFWLRDGHTSSVAKSKTEYIEYLKKELGEGNAIDLISKTEDGIAKYNLEEAAHKSKLATDVVENVLQPTVGMTLQETAEAKHRQWIEKHSPMYYLDQRYNTTPTNIKFGTMGWKYSVATPKGEKYTNKDFATIENNEALSEFYFFWTNLMAEMKSYLPEVAVSEMSENFFPTMQKDLLEEYMQNGSVAALSYLGKNTKIYGSIFADETLGLSRENEGLKSELDERGVPISKVPLRYLGSEGTDLKDRAFDLERVMIMFGNMAMNYKYKSEAEPLVNIMLRTVRESVQPLIDSSGKAIKRYKTGDKVTIKSNPQIILESLEYAQKSIMYGKSRESVKKTSWEFPGNLSTDFLARNRKAKEIKKKYERANELLADGTLTNAQYNAAVENLEEAFKALDIKAVSFNKIIRSFIGYTQLKGLGWNISAGIANVGFGIIATSIHAAGEEDFTNSQFMKSFRITLNGAVNPKASKAANILRRMNLLFEMREIAYGKGDVRGEKKFKMLGKLTPMYVQQSTEFIVQGVSGIAKMLNTVVVDKEGKERNLYEAFNEDGSWNIEEFGYQKDWDFKNLEATTKNKYTQFRDGAIEMNKKLHGNYDPNSLVRVKRKDINLLFTVFRTWAFEGFNTRYSKKVYNDQLGRYTKGRYNSVLNVGVKQSASILMKLLLKRFTGQKAENILTGVEDKLDAINLRKTLAALQMQITLAGLGVMLKGLSQGLDDDDEFSPALRATLNIMYRVEQDLSYYRNPITFLNIFKDPTPVIKTITDGVRAVDGTKRYILKEDYRGDHPLQKWSKVFPFTNQVYKWTVLTEKDLDTSYNMSDWIEENLLEDE